jgi:hypothetical protein
MNIAAGVGWIARLASATDVPGAMTSANDERQGYCVGNAGSARAFGDTKMIAVIGPVARGLLVLATT